MENVDQNSPPDKWLALHDASLDALVTAAPAPSPYRPYPGDHPCSVCSSDLAFVAVGWPKSPQWFCRKHLEEFLCLTSPRSSKPFAGQKPTGGATGLSIGKTRPTMSSEEQLTLFNDGPTNTGS